MTEQHLWEVKHDYYCSEGSHSEQYDSWLEFLDNMGRLDTDLNLVFRWDWTYYDDPDELESREEDEPFHELTLFAVLQRKGYLVNWTIRVEPEDEPAVRFWLQVRYTHMLKLWQPFAPADANESED